MQTLIDHLSVRFRTATARMAVSASLAALIVLFVVTAWFGLVAAFAIWMAERNGAVIAALSVSSVMLAAALVLASMSRWRRRRAIRRRRQALAASSIVPVLVPLLVRRGPIFALAAVAVFAFLLTRSSDTSD